MRFNLKATVAAVAVTAATLTAVAPADAQWRGRYHHHRHHGGGAAVLGGFAAGAILGGALAAQRPYYYERAPVYGGDATAYCLSRFKSYDPASGTYLGYDGYRHPCP